MAVDIKKDWKQIALIALILLALIVSFGFVISRTIGDNETTTDQSKPVATQTNPDDPAKLVQVDSNPDIGVPVSFKHPKNWPITNNANQDPMNLADQFTIQSPSKKYTVQINLYSNSKLGENCNPQQSPIVKTFQATAVDSFENEKLVETTVAPYQGQPLAKEYYVGIGNDRVNYESKDGSNFCAGIGTNFNQVYLDDLRTKIMSTDVSIAGVQTADQYKAVINEPEYKQAIEILKSIRK